MTRERGGRLPYRLSTKDQTLIVAYATEVVGILEGRTLNPAARERQLNYFGGIGAAMQAFEQIGGRKRELFIRGIGYALDDPGVDPVTKAELIDTFVTSAYNLTQLEPQIERLARSVHPLNEHLQEAIDVFHSDRELARYIADPKNWPSRF